jgi:hypothetical protein
VIGLGGPDLTEQAVLETPAYDVDVRQEAHPHRLDRKQTLGPGRLYQRHRLDGGACERLLNQHRLAGTQRQQRVVMVLGVRTGDVDGVDGRVADQRLIAAMSAFGSELGRERLSPFQRARADRHHPRRGPRVQRRGPVVGDPPWRQNAPSDGRGLDGIEDA